MNSATAGAPGGKYQARNYGGRRFAAGSYVDRGFRRGPGFGVGVGVDAGYPYAYGGYPYDSYAYYDGPYYNDTFAYDAGSAVGASEGAARDVEYCMRRFRSFDLASGTYLGYDGLRHPCP
jgi:hypothetical protein